jgi:hypothetical protein
MSKFVTVNPSFSPDQNFWDLNPQLIYFPPFSKAYDLDQGGKESSKIMWCVYFLADPDEENNRYYRMGPDRAKAALKEQFYPDIDWEGRVTKRINRGLSLGVFISTSKSS